MEEAMKTPESPESPSSPDNIIKGREQRSKTLRGNTLRPKKLISGGGQDIIQLQNMGKEERIPYLIENTIDNSNLRKILEFLFKIATTSKETLDHIPKTIKLLVSKAELGEIFQDFAEKFPNDPTCDTNEENCTKLEETKFEEGKFGSFHIERNQLANGMDIFTKKITILKTLIDKTIKEGEIFGERFTTMEKKFRHFQSRDEINGQFHQMKTSLVSLTNKNLLSFNEVLQKSQEETKQTVENIKSEISNIQKNHLWKISDLQEKVKHLPTQSYIENHLAATKTEFTEYVSKFQVGTNQQLDTFKLEMKTKYNNFDTQNEALVANINLKIKNIEEQMEEYLEKSIFTNFNDEFSKWKETKDKEIAQFYRSFSKFENKLNDSYKILHTLGSKAEGGGLFFGDIKNLAFGEEGEGIQGGGESSKKISNRMVIIEDTMKDLGKDVNKLKNSLRQKVENSVFDKIVESKLSTKQATELLKEEFIRFQKEQKFEDSQMRFLKGLIEESTKLFEKKIIYLREEINPHELHRLLDLKINGEIVEKDLILHENQLELIGSATNSLNFELSLIQDSMRKIVPMIQDLYEANNEAVIGAKSICMTCGRSEAKYVSHLKRLTSIDGRASQSFYMEPRDDTPEQILEDVSESLSRNAKSVISQTQGTSASTFTGGRRITHYKTTSESNIAKSPNRPISALAGNTTQISSFQKSKLPLGFKIQNEYHKNNMKNERAYNTNERSKVTLKNFKPL